MKSEELSGLASATCCWLAYREAIGIPSTLYERLMLVPISEYLSKSSWKLNSEDSYNSLFKDQKIEQYCDIVATKKSGSQKFAIETKLLKSKASSRIGDIEKDVNKLLNPIGHVDRYFMLAGRNIYFPELKETKAPSTARLFDRMLCYKYKEGFDWPPSNGRQNLGTFNSQYLRRCADETAPIGVGKLFRVVIWSIGAPKSAE